MSSTRFTTIALRRQSLPVRGLLAVVVAVLVNVAVVLVAGALGVAPGFQPLTVPPVAFLSALGAGSASAVYWLLGRLTDRPTYLFVRVALVVLLLSFVPDVALLVNDPAATVPGVLFLAGMHVVVAVVSVSLLVSREGDR